MRFAPRWLAVATTAVLASLAFVPGVSAAGGVLPSGVAINAILVVSGSTSSAQEGYGGTPGTTETIFVGTQGGGVYSSADQGATFTPVSHGLSKNVAALGYDSKNNILFAATDSGVYRSSNDAASWTVSNDQLTVQCFFYDPRDGALYAGTADGARTSIDDGKTWNGAGGTGANDPNGASITSIAADMTNPKVLYAASSLGMLKSSDGGATWSVFDNGDVGGKTTVLVDAKTDAVLGAGQNIFRSTDGGNSWTEASNGIASASSIVGLVQDPASGDLYTTASILYRSTDDGSNWFQTLDTSNVTVSALATDPQGTMLYVGTSAAGLIARKLSDLKAAAQATAAAQAVVLTSTAAATTPVAAATPVHRTTPHETVIFGHLLIYWERVGIIAAVVIVLLLILFFYLRYRFRRWRRRRAEAKAAKAAAKNAPPPPAPVTSPIAAVATVPVVGSPTLEPDATRVTGAPPTPAMPSSVAGGNPSMPSRPSTASAVSLDGQTLGGYQLGKRIGRGGMAEVYLANQPKLDRHVAVKVLSSFLAQDADFLTRFENEARAIGRLSHPNILAVHDYGEQNGIAYLAMAYAGGGTLRERIKQGPLPLPKVVLYIEQMGEALDYAHGKGLIHRDVKPQNMLFSAENPDLLFLSDFGIAKAMEDSSGLTGTGLGIGTPEYMAPEQSQGKGVDARSDVYALGVVLHELVTGKVPFTADTPIATMLRHIQEPPPDARVLNPGVPESVANVIRRAMAKAPEERYQTAREMVDALRVAVGQATPASREN